MVSSAVLLNHLNRIDIYLKRVRQDVFLDNPVQGMADTAELIEIGRRLYSDFQDRAKKQPES